MTLIVNTTAAKTNPTPTPTPMRVQPALAGREDVVDEGRRRWRRHPAKSREIDKRRGPKPKQKYHRQKQTKLDDRGKGRRAEYAERIGPGDRFSLFAAPAHFIEARCRKRPYEREAGDQWKQKRQK
jgi:hypothetical protein